MANRFWVGGTGTWDAADTTHWAATTGGAGGQTVPNSADNVIFDGSSGGGTATVNTTVNVISITMGAFTGTLDFATNDNNVTLQTFSGTGTGARTLNMGDGTWTITGLAWNCLTVTNFTFNANGSTLIFTNAASQIVWTANTSLSYNHVTINANASTGHDFLFNTGATIAGTFTVNGPRVVTLTASTMGAINSVGTASAPVFWKSFTINTSVTVTVASGSPAFTWSAFRDTTFAGGATFAATNSFNLGNTSGITITPPSVGGGVIGS